MRWRDKKPGLSLPEGKDPMKDAALKTSGSIPSGQGAAVLGRSLAVRGELSGNQDLLIEGQFDGTINVQDRCLTVALGAQVKANIRARRAVIHGSLSGNVLASERIEVRKTARVRGDLVTADIVVEEGASFNGSIDLIRVEARGLSDAAKPSAAKGGQSQA